MPPGWLKYIQSTYAEQPAPAATSSGLGTLIVGNENDSDASVLLQLLQDGLISAMNTVTNRTFDF